MTKSEISKKRSRKRSSKRNGHTAAALPAMAPSPTASAHVSHDVELTPIIEGQGRTVEVQGGFIRRAVPCDGLLLETEFTTLFLAEDEVKEALAKLAAIRKNLT